MLKRDLLIAPVCEAALLFLAAVIAWLVHKPMIFASLGPTAYELVETPERQSARPYNVVVGHLVGILAGFLALYVTNASPTPNIDTGAVGWPRIWAVVMAATITVAVTLLIRAAQPAAIATALLIALGNMQQWQDGFIIMGGVLLMLVLGEPIRNWRLRTKAKIQREAEQRA